MSATGSSRDRGAAGEQTSRLRAELAARRAASEIVAEANRMSDQTAVDAEAMIAEAESLAAELVDGARRRADAILAHARAEASSLTDGAAAERSEMAELRTRVEALVAQIGGGLGDLSTLLSTGTRAQAVAVPASWDDDLEVQDEPDPRTRESSLYAVASLPTGVHPTHEELGEDDRADDEVDRRPVPRPEPEAAREFDRVIETATQHERSDDLEDAGNDPRPLGWLFRGH